MTLVSQALRLFLLGVGAQLDLGAHLAMHTLCTACALATLPRYCTMPLVNNPLADARITAAHQAAAGCLLGLLPLGFPPGSRQLRCVAAMAFLCFWVGWLVPTWLVLKQHCEALVERQRRRRRRRRQRRGTPGAHGRSSSGSSRSGGHLGPSSSIEPLELTALDRSAQLALEWVFLEGQANKLGGGCRFSLHAWLVLAGFCWLAGALVALALVG
ncbi:hypothetical protein ABPG75_000267 [Micractinium tetrahymenae]